MTLSFWRYSHLALAVFSSLFLLLASVTGTILAVDAIQEKTVSYRAENFDTITLGETLPILKKNYPEITEVTVDHNQFVTLEGLDQKDNDVNAYIDPRTGKILGEPIKKSEFIQWITGLHRSLFLHETGRFFVGFISFILVLISISGFILILKRQRGIRNFFSKIIKDYFAQYYHVVLGRLALIPILIIAVTGTYLTLEKFNFFIPKTDSKEQQETVKPTPITDKASIFKSTLLADVEKIEFPFSDDPEEYYIITLKDREIEVNQVTGAVVSEKLFPVTTLLSNLSLDLHTGRTKCHLGFHPWTCQFKHIVFYLFRFCNDFQKKSKPNQKSNSKPKKVNTFCIVGSENGSSLRFANAILKQLTDSGEKAHIAELNNYTITQKPSIY